ncbi:uncharacterized protein LOC142016695 [Carettochelys insculpta]|uniref:uncharacterized protein LOC142016695 n=1 Tax=Carettochelys insculpta TaxID=44489 RepID=UPI003EC073A1
MAVVVIFIVSELLDLCHNHCSTTHPKTELLFKEPSVTEWIEEEEEEMAISVHREEISSVTVHKKEPREEWIPPIPIETEPQFVKVTEVGWKIITEEKVAMSEEEAAPPKKEVPKPIVSEERVPKRKAARSAKVEAFWALSEEVSISLHTVEEPLYAVSEVPERVVLEEVSPISIAKKVKKPPVKVGEEEPCYVEVEVSVPVPKRAAAPPPRAPKKKPAEEWIPPVPIEIEEPQFTKVTEVHRRIITEEKVAMSEKEEVPLKRGRLPFESMQQMFLS